MPEADIFATDFVAIAQGGTVSWTNIDGEEHFVTLVPGWSKPVNQPGLYYYYCPAHAHIIPTWNRAATHGLNRVYPLPMEGFVLVGGN